jgi:hypothetical protein
MVIWNRCFIWRALVATDIPSSISHATQPVTFLLRAVSSHSFSLQTVWSHLAVLHTTSNYNHPWDDLPRRTNIIGDTLYPLPYVLFETTENYECSEYRVTVCRRWDVVGNSFADQHLSIWRGRVPSLFSFPFDRYSSEIKGAWLEMHRCVECTGTWARVSYTLDVPSVVILTQSPAKIEDT